MKHIGTDAHSTTFGLKAATFGTPPTRESTREALSRRTRRALVATAWSILALSTWDNALAQGCRPVSERTAEVGCWILASVPLGQLSKAAVFWHLDNYPTRAEARAAKGPRGTVVEALGKVRLFTIGDAGWRPSGGVRLAQIGPLQVKSGEKYRAQYIEVITNPGRTGSVHRHLGTMAFYTRAGEVCLETPHGKKVGRAGESTIVPEGPPMVLTTTGTEQRRSLVLILHESSQPMALPVSDWTPKGLCKD